MTNVTEELTNLGRQLQVICAQVEILTSFVESRFGVRLVNKEAEVLQGVWQRSDEIQIQEIRRSVGFVMEEEMAENSKSKVSRQRQTKKRGRSSRRGESQRKERKNTKRDNITVVADDPEEILGKELQEDSLILNPQDFVETVYVQDQKRPKRLSRRKVNYSEEAANNSSSTHHHHHHQEDKEGGSGNKGKRKKPRSRDEESLDNNGECGDKTKKTTWNSSLPKQCDECGKVLKGTSTLKLHKMMHADERPHICEVCGNKFRFRRNLKVHMMAVHTGERPLQCSFCGRKFYAPKDLRIHERTHTGEKPYPCTICPKRFNVKEHLTMHMRVHTGEKPYKCLVCDKAFSQANSLRIHKKIHTRDPTEVKRNRKGNKGASDAAWKEDSSKNSSPLPPTVISSNDKKYESSATPSSSNINPCSTPFLQGEINNAYHHQEPPLPSSSTANNNVSVHSSFCLTMSDWRILSLPTTVQQPIGEHSHHHLAQQHTQNNSLRFGTNNVCRNIPGANIFPHPSTEQGDLEQSPQSDQHPNDQQSRFLSVNSFYSQNLNHH